MEAQAFPLNQGLLSFTLGLFDISSFWLDTTIILASLPFDGRTGSSALEQFNFNGVCFWHGVGKM